MRRAVKLRTLSTEEVTEIKRLAASKRELLRTVHRARVIAMMVEDLALQASDAG